MPTLRFILGPNVEIDEGTFKSMVSTMKNQVIQAFGAEVQEDVAVTVLKAIFVEGDADVQVDILFSAGEGDIDPEISAKNWLGQHTLLTMAQYLTGNASIKSRSVWICPMRGTVYRYAEIGK